MVVRSTPRVRIAGNGRALRLQALGDWESCPLDALSECARAQTALEKATRQTVELARDAGHSWTEIGEALGITKQTAWQRFAGDTPNAGTGEPSDRTEGDGA